MELTPKTRKEVFLAAAAGQDVTTPTPITREEVFLNAIAKGGGGGGGGSNKFIVTLTPTALDYSGTMDHTVAEINAAYEAGQEIVFRVYTGDGKCNEVDCTIRFKNEHYTYPSFNAYLVDNVNNVLVFAYTGAVDDGTDQTYATIIYPLTRAS